MCRCFIALKTLRSSQTALTNGVLLSFNALRGEKHWHGATSTTAMTHIAIQEELDGEVVDWMEHVTDEEYLKAR